MGCKRAIQPQLVFIFKACYHLLLLHVQLMLFMLGQESGNRLQQPPNGGTQLHHRGMEVIQLCLACEKRRK